MQYSNEIRREEYEVKDIVDLGFKKFLYSTLKHLGNVISNIATYINRDNI